MDSFGIAIGYNNAAGIADFTPYQPLTEGLQFTRRTDTVDGVVDEAPFIKFTWGQMSEAERAALFAMAGLTTLLFGPVTLYAQDNNYSWTYLNGTAKRPLNVGRRGYWIPNTVLTIISIFAASPP